MADDFRARRAIMKELLDNEELLNGAITTEDGGDFKVHWELVVGMSPHIKRTVLAAKDTPFESILIPTVSKEVMENIINFIYTLQLKLSMDTVCDVAKAGDLLEMPWIIELCRKHLIGNLNDECCFKIYIFSDSVPIPGLKGQVKPYILRRFQQIFPVSSDYLNLEISDLTEILSSDNLNVTGEDYVFWAIIRWIEHSPATRLGYLPNLLRCIRFGFCNPQFYESNIQSHPHIASSEECKAITLQAAQLFADMPMNEPSNIFLNARQPFLRPRTPNEIIFVMGGWSAGSATNVIETFDIKSGRWFLSLNSDTIHRAYHGMLWHLGYIYVVGGFDGNQCFNDVRRFDPVSHVWEEKGPMYFPRCYISVASLDNYIYAMGGYDGHRRTKSCERYDPELNQWTMMADMNHVRSDASADTLNGKIYIAGGFNGQRVLNSAECYDPKTNIWSEITSMIVPRSGVKVAAYNDYIFVIGGFNGNMRLQTVDKYDPRTRTWTGVADMNGPRSNFGTAVIYDCLYVIGGFNGLATVALAEYYDHRRNIWTPTTEMNLNRSALAACTVKDIRNAEEYTFLGNCMHM